MKKLLLIIMTILCLLVFPFKAGSAASKFPDVGNAHWALEEITLLSSKGVINGYGNGKFGPNDSITVNQGILMIERIVKRNVSFPVSGVNGTKPLTRGEVALLLEHSFDFASGEVFPFYDLDPTSPYYNSINVLTSNHIALGYNDGSFRPTENVTRAQFSVLVARILDPKFREVVTINQNVKQRILVTSTSLTTARVQLQELQGIKWQNVNPPYNAVIGKNGTGKTKEGDGKTPVGAYPLGTAFGWGDTLPNLKYPFKKATKNDYWVDDAKSKDYNKWITYTGDPNKRWSSYEIMTHSLYKYGVVIRYNDNPIVAGKGSAIFLHMKTSTTKSTLGCIALNENDLITVIKWLDKEKNPVILIK